ncbi:PAS domain S-box-containing protein [Dyadobacter sp. BE34]|uniref:histidine kinase n=1 Tax=Dyadobacter fermentans TaxID=94254 RepID=A0ABU1QYC6_9BACT|nr:MULTISPECIES: response regulator [Dyadobacter]MDR6806146.1 PAS domain S-box-containing protein [Dyadobacter fermentans]MDR7043887.1 PAS domain S-box-containing protein [Dyadobacter sp. BE242]MDR7198198.1 PAS domain S-box-containing protein [Dyadobacter sp. BE34]MDR7216161.1 PAS domain S-box-containing protein [Dyadobacter sp. BE31]MDR7264313.1 PAS domain S-box-containing protein [Dyadobacter sp. BE32]
MPTRITNDSFRWYYASIYLGLAMIFGSQYFTYKNVRDLSLNNERLNVTIGVLNQTANFGLVTKDFQSNMRGYLITQNNDLLTDNYNKKVQLVGITDTLFNLVKDDDIQTKRVKDLLEISSQIVLYSQNVISIYRTQGTEQAFTKIQEGEGIRLNNLLTRKINEIEDYEKNNMDQRRKLVSDTQQNSVLFILLTGAVGFILTILSIVFLNLDKRKQRQFQKEIKERERTMSQYLEAIPDGVMVINSERKIELLNESGREILGVAGERPETLEEQVTRIKLLDPTRYHVRFSADTLPVARALQGEKLAGNKIDLVKNDKIYHLETSVQPVIGLDGQIKSAITVFRDITERANYEATLEKARILAEKSVRVKDIFLSNVSHEIRTPLNAIIGFTNLLLGEVTDPKSLEYVGYIQYAGKNLLELINDILDFSKIEAGQIHLEKTPVSIHELADSISAIMHHRAVEKGIAYEAVLEDGLPEFIETDKLRLTQILLNVCGNAVKFTERGSVKLHVEPIGEPVNEVQNIRFRVVDTGVGIPKDKLKEVFNRFVQATESTTRVFGGTGLGLSIVKSLVQLFEGTLNLESELGKGTVFTMDFPFRIVKEAELEEELEKEIDVTASVTALHILAAEDNSLNQKLLKAIFERLNIPLTIVNNGQEALDKLREGTFDLVLMDIQMPVMDGYTAIKEIRRTISTTIPIITMTAHAMVGEKEECLSIGANSYISKPFKESELLYTIAHLGNKEHYETPQPPNFTQQPSQTKMTDSILNLDYLAEITGGDQELRDELIAMFEKDSQIQLKSIGEASQANDLERLRQAIHKFRSSLFSVGLLNTANQYKELEATLKQGKWTDDLNQRLIDLKAEAETGLTQLKLL